MEEKKYLKWYNKVGYGSGDIAGNVVFAFLSSFIMIYLTNTVGLNAGVIGSLIAASKVLDGISDVVFGSMIDRTHTKMGKARPWMLGAYFGCAITLIAAFSVPTTMGKTSQYVWFFITYLLLNAGFYTANNIAYSTLTALITKNVKERVQMGSIRFMFAFGTSFIIQTITVGLVQKLGGGAEGWRTIAIIYAIIGLISNTLTVFSVKELPEEELRNGEEKVEEKDNTENIKDMLKESYKNLKESLMSIISDIMDTDDFVEGDNLYQPLLNGDLIDYDYSPEVNAENILGGWEPDKFCFPLYRHLLIMKNYDSTEAKEEFEAIYKIDDKDVKVPENMYDADENIDTVLEQIATRFEEDVRPSRFALVLAIKKQLVEYYKHVDEYYENKMEQKMKTSLDSCDYYYKIATQSTEILKDMREAKGKMERELKDYLDMTLEESLGVNKLVYFYNYIELMDNIQDDIRTVICDIDIMSKHGNIKDIIKDIRNKYYEITRRLISDNKFDIFKYGPSYISEVGYKRELKPKLQCRLVDKDSNIDEYQPLIFTREKYRLLRIEKRFEKLFKANEVNLSDIVHKLDSRQLYYTITDIDKYVFKRNKDNLRYLMTEFEYNLLSEYENLYGMTHMNDVDKLYADCIVNILNEKYNLCEDTYNLFKDIAHLGLNDALSIRYMIINMLDIQDISRLDYLNNIK